MSDSASPESTEVLAEAPWLRRFPLRTPTLPPATHTNVYALGEGELLIVDPASPYPEEQERLRGFLGALERDGHRPVAALLTHHHLDHISGAAALGLPLWAHPLTARRLSGRGLVFDRLLDEGERLPFGPEGLLCLHTPGHAPGHLCLLDEMGRNAIVGDMVASTGTIVIDPDDDGDMGEYLRQLGRLRRLSGPLRLWPAHGASVADGAAHLDFYVHHRLAREGKVLRALEATGGGPIGSLLPHAYDDVPPQIYPLAAHSLRAHLHKLEREGRAAVDGAGAWRLVGPPDAKADPTS